MGVEFTSDDEFVEVMDRTFTMMSEDPDMGPKLRDADVPQRFEFTDLDLVVNIRAAEDDEEERGEEEGEHRLRVSARARSWRTRSGCRAGARTSRAPRRARRGRSRAGAGCRAP